jgi:hypothetical protein
MELAGVGLTGALTLGGVWLGAWLSARSQQAEREATRRLEWLDRVVEAVLRGVNVVVDTEADIRAGQRPDDSDVGKPGVFDPLFRISFAHPDESVRVASREAYNAAARWSSTRAIELYPDDRNRALLGLSEHPDGPASAGDVICALERLAETARKASDRA